MSWLVATHHSKHGGLELVDDNGSGMVSPGGFGRSRRAGVRGEVDRVEIETSCLIFVELVILN